MILEIKVDSNTLSFIEGDEQLLAVSGLSKC